MFGGSWALLLLALLQNLQQDSSAPTPVGVQPSASNGFEEKHVPDDGREDEQRPEEDFLPDAEAEPESAAGFPHEGAGGPSPTEAGDEDGLREEAGAAAGTTEEDDGHDVTAGGGDLNSTSEEEEASEEHLNVEMSFPVEQEEDTEGATEDEADEEEKHLTLPAEPEPESSRPTAGETTEEEDLAEQAKHAENEKEPSEEHSEEKTIISVLPEDETFPLIPTEPETGPAAEETEEHSTEDREEEERFESPEEFTEGGAATESDEEETVLVEPKLHSVDMQEPPEEGSEETSGLIVPGEDSEGNLLLPAEPDAEKETTEEETQHHKEDEEEQTSDDSSQEETSVLTIPEDERLHPVLKGPESKETDPTEPNVEETSGPSDPRSEEEKEFMIKEESHKGNLEGEDWPVPAPAEPQEEPTAEDLKGLHPAASARPSSGETRPKHDGRLPGSAEEEPEPAETELREEDSDWVQGNPSPEQEDFLWSPEEELGHSAAVERTKLGSHQFKVSVAPVQDEAVAPVSRGAILGAALVTLVSFIVTGFVGLTISKKLR